ncbi:uroporphyrinogen-III synthase [Novispirillum sp. DQ9]|uniref:uroporphyrinogen-III synthase n=1 Tax=Novispirillum sp. DQ9 TaxID=3398612 RepID=UPI003C7B1CC2
MRAVVTRPVEDAERIAAPLRDRGVDVMVEPLLAIVPRAGVEVDTSGVQAILLTSANGVRALASALGSNPVPRHIPALAVGDQTAAVAREHGFVQVTAAEGEVNSLAALARASLDPKGGPLLHAAGSHVAGDLVGMLQGDGFTVRRVQLYESRTAAAFSQEFQQALRDRAVDAVLLYSPRTAKTFATLAEQGDLRDACRGVAAYCLSQAVADALGDLPFAAVRIAPRPEQDALLTLFDEDNHHRFRPAAGASALHHQADPQGERTMSDRPAGSGDTSKTQEAKDAPGAKDVKPPQTATPGTTTGATSPSPTTSTSAPSSSTKTAKPGGGGTGGHKGLIAAGVVLLVLLVLYASLPWWRSSLPPEYQAWTSAILPKAEADTALRGEIDDLQAALVALRGSVRGLESRVDRLAEQQQQQQQQQQPAADTGASAEDLAALRQQVEQLSRAAASQNVEALGGRVAELENSRAAASTVLDLSERVNRVEAQARDASARQESALAFLMGALQLREAVAAGRPFDAELRSLAAVAPQGVDIAAAAKDFAAHADSGIVPLVVLRQRLAAQGEEIIRAAARPDEGDGWWNRTVDRALSVVSVRRTDGEAVGDGTAAIVSRAEQRLAAGNLAAAVGELGALQGGPAEAAAPWLRDARAHLAAEEAVADLTAEALARVGARGQAAAGQEG